MRKLLALLLAGLATQAFAQATYPAKPVRIIVAFTPGSSTDIIGRAVAAKLQEMWGHPVIVENRAGAGGTVGSAAALREPADGYTLLANSSAHVSNPSIYRSLPYDTLKDFANIAPLAGGPNVLIVGPQAGWKTLGDFIAAAKAKPGQLNFSSAGIGSGTHFNLEKLKLMAGVDVTHVPYKGTPEAIGDTVSGRVCCYFAPINAALPHVNGGRAIALGVSSAQRSSLLPNLPTIAEQGVPGFDYTLWVGLWGQAAMPGEIVAKINGDVRKALGSPDLKERLTRLGTLPMDMSPQQFSDFVRREIDDTAKVVRAAGIQQQ